MSPRAGSAQAADGPALATPVRVKICGLTRIEDAEACVELGVDALGLNFVPASPRCVNATLARRIVERVAGRALVVGVVADLNVDAMRALKAEVGLGCLQLHGDEPDVDLRALLPHAYKALRIASAGDVARARAYAGEHVLVDAKVEGLLGGSGTTFDWALVVDLAKERKLTLAGGLTPDNVARAVARVAPYCVDVASGVEKAGGKPGEKDLARVEAFLRAVR